MKNREQMERTIAALEAQRAVLGDAVVDASINALQEQLATLENTVATTVASTPFMVTVLVAQADQELPADRWAPLVAAVTENGGSVGQQTPQRLTVTFGDETSPLDMVESAVWVALGLRKADKLRIGLHTDYVTMVNDEALYPLLNEAHRLTRQAAPGQILLSHQTYHRVRGVFDVKPLDAQIYLVEEAKPRAFRLPAHAFEGIETRMVGRTDELRRLQDALHTVRRDSQLRCLTIVGVMGVGKSRLLYEFDKWLELLPDEAWYFMSRASQETNQIPFGLMRQIFSYRFAINDHDPPEVAREKLVDGILDFMGTDQIEEAHVIGHLLGFDFGHSSYLMGVRGDIAKTREAAFSSVARFFRAVATTDEAPVVLVIEDLHWCDRGSLELLEYIGRACRDIPLLALCATQPSLFDSYPEWGTDKSFHTIIELRSLSEAETGELFDEIFQKSDQITPGFRNDIVNRVAGNPYHLEQLVKFLIEENLVIPGVHEWRIDQEQLATLQIPNSLTDVILGRLYGLPLAERITLQRAAVVGYVFWDRAVEHLNQYEQSQQVPTAAALQSLVQRDMIVLQETSTFANANEYMFGQEALHEVAYDSLRQQIRHRYHIQLAQWFIGRSMEHVGEHAGLIAFHFAKAGEVNRAVKWYGLAALQAKKAYMPEIAIRYYEQALMLLPDNNDDMQLQIRLYEGFGQVLDSQARYMDAVSAYTAVCIAAERAGDTLAQSRAWNALAQLQINQDDPEEALYCAERATRLAEEAGGQNEMVQSWLTMGMVYFSLEKGQEALQWIEQAGELAEQLGDLGQMAQVLKLEGMVCSILQDYDRSLESLHQTIELCQTTGDRVTEAQALSTLAEIVRRRGDLEAAVTYNEQAVTIARELKIYRDIIIYVSNLGGALVSTGQYTEALRHLQHVVNVVGETGWWGLVGTYRAMAQAFLGIGDVTAAREAALNAMNWAQRHDNPWDRGVAWQVLGQVALGDHIEVEGIPWSGSECFEKSQAILKSHNRLGDCAETLRLWANHEYKYGDRSRAAELWNEARAIYEKLAATGWLEKMDNDDLAQL